MMNDRQNCSNCRHREGEKQGDDDMATRPVRRVFSVPESAEILGISRSTAYELVGAGKLRSIRLGRRILVPMRAIEALIEGEGR